MGELTNSITSPTVFPETERLVVRLKEGDEAAFREVFQLYKDLIFNLSWNMLADKSEAMDVTQEVFFTLHCKIHQFRGESSLKTWLYRVALNHTANRNRWWKRRLRHRTISLNLGIPLAGEQRTEPASDRPQADRCLLSREVNQALHEALSLLPAKQRAAVILRDIHGLSYEEIAGTVGAQIGTVKSRIARGRERLRELLKPYWNGGSL